ASDPWQHVGFSINMQEPWAIFSTFTGGALYARTAVGVTHIDTQIPGSWLGAAHRFRIDWTSSGAVYWIDGTQVASHSIAMTANMRPVVSDATVGGGVLTVDWMWMTPPYVASGTFLSRVLDAGAPVTWLDATWSAAMPAGTSLAVSVRLGDTPTPDASWSSFIPLGSSGAAIGRAGRYLQYRASLATTNAELTPVLR